jgi:hypothetical protein
MAHARATTSEIADAWLAYQARKDDADFWAREAVMEFAINGDMDRLWAVIQELCARTDPEDLETISLIGAAPLEELLVTFGDAAMDLVEPAVDKSTTLLRALAMVWGWNAPVRPRIERALELRGQAPL